jgi:phosphoribosylformylglycinamidine cyclo-ligase
MASAWCAKILEAHQIDGTDVLAPGGPAVIESLLTPTRLYGSLVQALLAAAIPLHGMAHITGGGLPENLPRCLPAGLQARIDPASWQRPDLFHWLPREGEVPETDLWHTFNLGVGYCLVVPETAVAQALAVCQARATRPGGSVWWSPASPTQPPPWWALHLRAPGARPGAWSGQDQRQG